MSLQCPHEVGNDAESCYRSSVLGQSKAPKISIEVIASLAAASIRRSPPNGDLRLTWFPDLACFAATIADGTNLRGAYRQKHEDSRVVIQGRSGDVSTMHSHTLLILAKGFAEPAGRLRMWKSGSIRRELPTDKRRAEGALVRA